MCIIPNVTNAALQAVIHTPIYVWDASEKKSVASLQPSLGLLYARRNTNTPKRSLFQGTSQQCPTMH